MQTIFLTLQNTDSIVVPLQKVGNALTFKFHAPAGLYQFSVVADASNFDWEELYVELNAFHNCGQRTGPWDFHPVEGHRPLIPSYWVYLDGRKIGLWFFERVSLSDLATRQFRGKLAFWLRDETCASEHELKLVPYRDFNIDWISARLENDPQDSLWSEIQPAFAQSPSFTRWKDPAFWDEKRKQLQITHVEFAGPLTTAFVDMLQNDNDLPGAPQMAATAPNEWLVLLLAYRLENNREALEELLRSVDEALALPHWGNPREDGYSHNGDMHAAFLMRGLAWVYHGLEEELGAERQQQIREKLVLQGERFIEACLLNRDYWGGSLLQDHGWRSTHTFTTAALCLLEVIPEAREWLRYFLPRAKRALAAMPRDGVVPATSYNSFVLYLNDIADLREVWLAWNGEDIYDEYPFHEVVDFVSVAHPQITMIGGGAFFYQIAQKYGDERAAWIARRLLQKPEQGWVTFSRRQGYYSSLVQSFLSYDPSVKPCKPEVNRPLHYFPDSGQVYFFHPQNDVALKIICGPFAGYHAYRYATGPCDRLGEAPGAGHFTLSRGTTRLLPTPDGGYALQSLLRSCLLIDGQGQCDDVSYPMFIPSKQERGGGITHISWDETTQSGIVRLNLASAYPEKLELIDYTREFLIDLEKIRIRDYVALRQPKTLSWLFQGKRETGIALLNELQVCFGREESILLEAKPLEFNLSSAIALTPVVWSYSSASGFKPFDHVRFDSTEPLQVATVDFTFTWHR